MAQRNPGSLAAALLCAVFCAPPAAFAQQDDAAEREAEMFGAPAPAEAVDPRDEEVFGEPEHAGPPAADRFAEPQTLFADPLQVGGRLYLRLDGYVTEETDAGDQALRSPNLMDVFLDARPTDRVRAFALGRLHYDPTGDAAPFPGAPEPNRAELDQLWLRFDIERRVFFTLGKQPVKWGAAHVWNPTDFVNRTRRDPLSPFDFRLGVPLARVHVPIEAAAANLYAMALLDESSTVGEVGGAARAEIAFGTTELSVSTAVRRDRPLRIGADVSTGLGDFDLIVEAAVSHGNAPPRWTGRLDPGAGVVPTAEDRDDDWIPQVTGGLEWSIGYGDRDMAIVGVEYFFNDAGYDDAELYPWLLFTGDYEPLYVARHAAALYLVLPAPGGWNDTTFTLTAIGNVTDRTGVARLNVSQLVLTRLTIEPYVAAHFGERGGEFRFTTEVPAIGGRPGFTVQPPVAQAGIWLRAPM